MKEKALFTINIIIMASIVFFVMLIPLYYLDIVEESYVEKIILLPVGLTGISPEYNLILDSGKKDVMYDSDVMEWRTSCNAEVCPHGYYIPSLLLRTAFLISILFITLIFSVKWSWFSKTVRILLSACVILSYLVSWYFLSNLASKVFIVNGWFINVSAEDINVVYLYGILSLIVVLTVTAVFLILRKIKADQAEQVQKV